MKSCSKCGAQLNDDDKFCLYCGMPQGSSKNDYQAPNNNGMPQWDNGPGFHAQSQDEGSLAGGICLRLFLGVVGLIIACFMKPKTKKGGVIGFCINIAVNAIGTIIAMIVGGGIMFGSLYF